jgi:hypothetical protein
MLDPEAEFRINHPDAYNQLIGGYEHDDPPDEDGKMWAELVGFEFGKILRKLQDTWGKSNVAWALGMSDYWQRRNDYMNEFQMTPKSWVHPGGPEGDPIDELDKHKRSHLTVGTDWVR